MPATLCPPKLARLSMVEKALISLISPMAKLVRLPHNGVGYSGRVVAFPKHALTISRVVL